jgi:mono/diheme cytochrome c family protein
MRGRPSVRGIMAALVFLACGSALARAEDADLVKRGEYLARAGDCVACHTAPGGEPLAGGLKMDTPFGPIFTPNLTPDRETGIGAWSDDEFYRALHEGIGRKGEYLYPVFPFPWYKHVARDDVLAIKAYLFSLKPVHAQNKPNGFRFPFNIRDTLVTWRALFFTPGKTETAPSGDRIARGRYLVEGLGHCGECHNRHNVLGASDWSGKLQGGEIEGWYAPNLTSDGRQGVGEWSEDEIATFLKTGGAPGKGVALGPMQETINDSLRYLSDDDLHAMAAYLKSVPAKETFANNGGGYQRTGAPGEDLYLDHCSSCHGLKGQGAPGHVPALAGNGAVMAGGPQDVIRVVLGGLTPAHGLGPMPAIGAGLSDQDIARVADYVRNSFGNAAPASVDPSMVETLRSDTHTPMAAVRPEDCAKPQLPEVQAQLSGGQLDALTGADPVDLLPALDALIDKLKPVAEKSPDLVVADLAAAYCPVLFKDAKASQPQRADRLGRFATLAYSRVQTLVRN